MSLTPDRFPEFFEALWGYPPFPWQARLARQVCEEGWPRGCLDLPTAAGKTAVLDVAVYALAVSASSPARAAPRRIVLVVDRRVIVDQAHERTQRIARALNTENATGVLAEVRAALIALKGEEDGPALATAVLRGGMLKDHSWARSPVQPLLASSTVDQVGSRLLFRGYGVTPSMWPIHAGLLGSDTLYLLDEVHLSEPFAETLQTLQGYAASPLFPARVERPLRVVRMSATPSEGSGAPGGDAAEPFALLEEDRTHPLLERRLAACKPATLCAIKTKGEETLRRAVVAAKVAELVRGMLSKGQRRIGVVVNRIDTARRVHAELEGDESYDCVLLTGRMRPLDRERVFTDDVKHRVTSGSLSTDERTTHRPIVVVATQTIEAGADFDFDSLVTECASLDALRQRFGRLNRLGSPERALATIFVRAEQVRPNADPDPIYRDALRATWKWLQEVAAEAESGCVDMGIAALERHLAGVVQKPLIAPKEAAPPLFPAHLDHLARTRPAGTWNGRDEWEPQVWLHGPTTASPDVQVVWRGDLAADELVEAEADQEIQQSVIERVAACPPAGIEAISIPVWALASWLRAAEVDSRGELSDVEGAREDDGPEVARRSCRPALRWQGDDSALVTRVDQIRPGGTYVVPAEYGGIGARSFNWDPDASAPVSDLGDEAQFRQRGVASVRFHPRLLREVWGTTGAAAALSSDDEELPGPAELWEALEEWLEVRRSDRDLTRWQSAVLDAFGRGRRKAELQVQTSWPDATSKGAPLRYLVAARRLSRPELARIRRDYGDDPSPVSTEEEYSSFVGREVPLSDHLAGVGGRAERYAASCGLTPELVQDLALAGALHDLGKADPRFQLMLHGADEIACAGAELLAKSAIPARDRSARRLAQLRSGYPVGYRHELASLALIQDCAELRDQAHDWDLVLHLVASHHGHCRPFAPAVLDAAPVEVTLTQDGVQLSTSSDHGLAALSSGISARYGRVTARYGWHGLAYLESILRLADHRQSEWEERNAPAREKVSHAAD